METERWLTPGASLLDATIKLSQKLGHLRRPKLSTFETKLFPASPSPLLQFGNAQYGTAWDWISEKNAQQLQNYSARGMVGLDAARYFDRPFMPVDNLS